MGIMSLCLIYLGVKDTFDKDGKKLHLWEGIKQVSGLSPISPSSLSILEEDDGSTPRFIAMPRIDEKTRIVGVFGLSLLSPGKFGSNRVDYF